MTNYREILRLFSLGISNSEIAAACGCSRTTVISVLARADSRKASWPAAAALSDKELNPLLRPGEGSKVDYMIPDYEYVHREMGKSGVTLTILWMEYCDQLRQSRGPLPPVYAL